MQPPAMTLTRKHGNLTKGHKDVLFGYSKKNPKVQTCGFEHLQMVVTRRDVLFNEIDFRFFERKTIDENSSSLPNTVV
jgi:hypothetical protein